MAVELALYQPDIPQNTGTLLRLAACLDFRIHIIHPTGFHFSNKQFRRSSMDYANHVDLKEHNSFEQFNVWRLDQEKRLVLMSTKASSSVYGFSFADNDILMAGRESAGVPAPVAEICDSSILIPMKQDVRSINVAVAAAMVMGEAKRQTNGFELV